MRITEALQVSSDWLLRTNVPTVGVIEEIIPIRGCIAYDTDRINKYLDDMRLPAE